MHSKIQDFISALLISMSEDEKAIFLTERRKTADYMALYRIYLDSKNKKSLLKNLTEFKVGKTAEAFNDLNSVLYQKLLLFLAENDKKIKDEIQILEDIIAIVNTLIKRKLFKQAADELKRAYRILKKIDVNEFNYHLFLKYLNLTIVLQKPPYRTSSSLKLENDFEEIEILNWLNKISAYAGRQIAELEDSDGADFIENVFFNLMGIYHFEQQNYKDFIDWVGENIALNMKSFFKEFQSNKKLDDTIKSIKILSILEAIYAGYKLNNKSIVDEYANILKVEVFHTRDAHYQTFAFLLLHLFDIQLKMDIDSNIPIGENYYDTKVSDLKLFTENELENMSIRVEINKGIIHFYNKNFEKSEEIFKKIDTKKIKTAELRYYIRFYELLSSLSYGYNNFNIDNFLNSVQYLRDVKNKKSSYSKGLLNIIEKHQVTYKITNYIKDFLEKNKANTLFDSVLENWARNLI